MLILSRKQSESIRIGDDLVIHVKRIKGNRIRLGIEAPQDVQIRRGELSEETMDDSSGMRLLIETEVGKEARRNATQTSTDVQQYAD